MKWLFSSELPHVVSILDSSFLPLCQLMLFTLLNSLLFFLVTSYSFSMICGKSWCNKHCNDSLCNSAFHAELNLGHYPLEDRLQSQGRWNGACQYVYQLLSLWSFVKHVFDHQEEVVVQHQGIRRQATNPLFFESSITPFSKLDPMILSKKGWGTYNSNCFKRNQVPSRNLWKDENNELTLIHVNTEDFFVWYLFSNIRRTSAAEGKAKEAHHQKQ